MTTNYDDYSFNCFSTTPVCLHAAAHRSQDPKEVSTIQRVYIDCLRSRWSNEFQTSKTAAKKHAHEIVPAYCDAYPRESLFFISQYCRKTKEKNMKIKQ